MKKVKQVLAVLMAMALLCGFTAFGVSAADAEPAQLTDAQFAELMGYMPAVLSLAAVELALQRVPGWLNWAVFAKGSSWAAMEAELQAELKKAADYDHETYIGWLLSGEIMEHGVETLAYGKVLAEKGPDIIKKHCVFYIGWLVDGMLFVSGFTGGLPLFA